MVREHEGVSPDIMCVAMGICRNAHDRGNIPRLSR